jgi:hypothetical protein
MPYTANKKPSGLDPASSVGNDTLVIEQSGSVLKATVDQVVERAFSAKGVNASASGSEVLVVRDGSTLKDLPLSNVVPNDNITNAKVASNAAIAGTKINPNFGSQAISTTGSTSTGTLTVTGTGNQITGTLTVNGALTANGGINATITGNSTTATQLATTRNIAATSDIAWNVNFNGSADVTAAATIQNNVVTDAKLRTSGACSVVGRSANTTGNVADIASSADDQVLRRASGALGFGAIATGGISDNAVANTKLRDSAALSVIGRSANTSGDPGDIAAANDGEVLRRSGPTLGFGQVAAAGLATDAVETVKIRDLNVTSSKLADGAITGAAGGGKLAASAITGQTAIDSLANADTLLVHDDSTSALRKVTWSQIVAAAQPVGSVVNTKYAQLVGVNTYSAGQILGRTTTPTISSGVEILAINSFSTSANANEVVIQVAAQLSSSTATSTILMLFAGNTLVATSNSTGGNSTEPLKIIYKHSPPSTSPISYTVRAACEGGTLYISRQYTVTDYNTGKQVASMLLQEIKG